MTSTLWRYEQVTEQTQRMAPDAVREIVAKNIWARWTSQLVSETTEGVLKWSARSEIERETYRRMADAILTAITEAGYSVVETAEYQALIGAILSEDARREYQLSQGILPASERPQTMARLRVQPIIARCLSMQEATK